MIAQDAAEVLLACNLFQHLDHAVRFPGIKQRQGAVMAGDIAIQPRQFFRDIVVGGLHGWRGAPDIERIGRDLYLHAAGHAGSE